MAGKPSEPGAAVLRPLQNKIRNLRKAIDRATPLAEAAARGDELQADQVESVRSRPAKVALLADLEEILRKQESAAAAAFGAVAAAATPVSEVQGESKRAAKRKAAAAAAEAAAAEAAAAEAVAAEAAAAEAAAAEAAVAAAASETAKEQEDVVVSEQKENMVGKLGSNGDASADTEREETKGEAGNVFEVVSDAGATGGLSLASIDGLPASQVSNGGDFSVAGSVPEPANDAGVESTVRVKDVIELLHVVEYLKDPENRRSLAAYFDGRESELSKIDVDIVLYFGAMLVSPNGNIPHENAVETSTMHCLNYLSKPTAEPFSGTSYGRLSQIVSVIGRCPLLERNADISDPPMEAAHAPSGEEATPDSSFVPPGGDVQEAAVPVADSSGSRREVVNGHNDYKNSSGDFKTHRGGGRGRGRGGKRGRGGPYRGRGGGSGGRGRGQ